MRTLVIGDIHGCYDLFVDVLKKAQYNNNIDRLVLIGDYIDRGPDSKRVLDLVMQLSEEGAVVIAGNHEEMLLSSYKNPVTKDPWLLNGGDKTLLSFGIKEITKESVSLIPKKYIDFISGLPFYYENKDYIFVHAGLDPDLQQPELTNKYALIWLRDEWLRCKYTGEKTVIFGHSPTFTINSHSKATPWVSGKKICIDTGAVYPHYGGKLTCLELPGITTYTSSFQDL